MKRILMASSVIVGFTGFASAATTIIEDNSDVLQTNSMTGFVTHGDDMVGMEVSVTYSDASTATATWGATGVDAGAAVSAGAFSLSLTGDTFTADWTLTNLDGSLAITGFSLDGLEGSTVFDRTFTTALPTNGTPGSDAGADFDLRTGGDATGTYSNPLKLIGDPIVGDLFVALDVSLDTPLAAADSLTFGQDADNATTRPTMVPEPSTGLGIGLLLSAAFFLRRRK